jgi:HEAT repeat protein
MSDAELAILNRVNADNWAELYRCRWSTADAERVVAELAELLASQSPEIIQETLRALYRIGSPAISLAPQVAGLTRSSDPMTKRLAVLTLGAIAHTMPSLCVEPLASTLHDQKCCRDALRILASIGPPAQESLDRVKPLFFAAEAKVRKAAVETASAINVSDPDVVRLLHQATADRSKEVRDAASKRLKAAQTG